MTTSAWPVRENVLGLDGRSDHADGAGQDGGFAANLFGERRLVSGADGNLRAGYIAAGRAIDQIYA